MSLHERGDGSFSVKRNTSWSDGADVVLCSGAWLVAPMFIVAELGNEIVNNLVSGAGVKRD